MVGGICMNVDDGYQPYNRVAYALDQGYKLAVHHMGITDWSAFKDEYAKDRANRRVELMQLAIARMILGEMKDEK